MGGFEARFALCIGIALLALGAVTAGASAKPKPKLQVTRLESSTVGHRDKTAKPGATLKSCESDPLYAVSFYYRWSGMKEPGKERVLVTGPQGYKEDTGTNLLFESHGSNAFVVAPIAFGAKAETLPDGTYRFKATLDGITRTASLKVVSASC
jgi:uncharacterized protein (DUF58 family)